MAASTTTEVRYRYREGSVIPIDPQVAGEHLAELREQLSKDGMELTPAIVVEDARPEESPIHGAFEWDDSAAAEQFRLQQARNLTNSLRIEVVTTDRVEHVPAFVNVVTTKQDAQGNTVAQRHYEDIHVVMNDPILREQVLEQARREIASWRKRYRMLSEFAPDFFRAVELFTDTTAEAEGEGA